MRTNERGQIALTIALIIAVVSAVSMSVVSRSISEVGLSGIDQSASKAIRSAEAGAEQGLSELGLGSQTVEIEPGTTYTVNVEQGGTGGFLSANSLNAGEVAEISLAGSTGLTSIDIWWGDRNDSVESATAAIQILKYQRYSASDYRRVTLVYDPNATRINTNNFSAPSVNPGTFMGVNFGAFINVPIVAEDILVRVKPLYNKARLGVGPEPAGATLGNQFYTITSSGVSGGNVFRKVQVASSSAGMPEIFDMTLYSGSTLNQQ